MARRKGRIVRGFGNSGLRTDLCRQVAKIASYLECGKPDLAKQHATELIEMLEKRILLVDSRGGTCNNGHPSQDTGSDG